MNSTAVEVTNEEFKAMAAFAAKQQDELKRLRREMISQMVMMRRSLKSWI